jgi:hypothetical protein
MGEVSLENALRSSATIHPPLAQASAGRNIEVEGPINLRGGGS